MVISIKWQYIFKEKGYVGNKYINVLYFLILFTHIEKTFHYPLFYINLHIRLATVNTIHF